MTETTPMTPLMLTADLPGIGGILKQSPEDFIVEEIPAYEPNGEGEHLFLWIEKHDTAAEQLTQHIARCLVISNGEIGVAGLKDKRAVTRQYVSVPFKAAERVPEIDTDQIHVLKSERHVNKLRTGHLRGNRFTIVVRDVADGALARAQAILQQINRLGFPNYYGEQRFGSRGDNVQTGMELLSGRKTPRSLPGARRKFLLRLMLSSVQSQLFNNVLESRLRDGLLHQVLDGDVMQVVASGGSFVVEDATTDQGRFDEREIVITGPIFGGKMRQPTGVVAEREAQILTDFGLTLEDFDRFKKLLSGTRRPFLIWPDDLAVTEVEQGLQFTFTLPSGVYATTLLREFMKTDADRS